MNVLIIGNAKLKYMPYVNFYVDNIDSSRNKVHLVYWNRDLTEEDVTKYEDLILHEFRYFQKDEVAKWSKIVSYLKYRKFVKKIIKTKNFDFIFALDSQVGVLIFDTLIRKYKNKYIFDYRDSTYEGFAPFKKVIGCLVENSFATFVSSNGFKCFFPKKCEKKIYTSHNLLMDSLLHREEKEMHGISSNKIRISYWGLIRDEVINREIIKKICNDERFELHYYGREEQTALNLKLYANQLASTNVFFHGEYKPEERYNFARETDVVHNIFCDANMMLAMSNRYYDGIIFRIPQICMEGSFMEQQVTNAGVGYACNPYDSCFADKLYEYYQTNNREEFNRSCDVELERVLGEYAVGVEVIRHSIEKKE